MIPQTSPGGNRFAGLQLVVLCLGLTATIVMGLFPPVLHKRIRDTLSGGSILSEMESMSLPKEYEVIEYEWLFELSGARIDLARLLVQWTVVAAATVLVVMLVPKAGGSEALNMGWMYSAPKDEVANRVEELPSADKPGDATMLPP